MIEGCDVSRFQPPAKCDWGAMANAGITFAFIQADEAFRDHVTGARAGGVLPMAYRFLMLTQPIEPQIDSLAQAVSDAGITQLVGLDCEHNPDSVPIPARLDMYTEAVQRCLALGLRPAIYTYPFYDNKRWPSDFGALPLWISSPRAKPDIVAPWTDWSFWQFTDDATVVQFVPGYPGHALRDRFNGTAEDLAALLLG